MAAISCFRILVVVLLFYGFSGYNSKEFSFSNPHRGADDRNGLFSSIHDYAISLVLKTLKVVDAFQCVSACLKEPSCQSINFDTSGHPKHLCELSHKTLECSPDYKEPRPGFIHYNPVKDDPCRNITCKNGATCESACNKHGFLCKCGAFNTGQYCQLWTVDVSSCEDIFNKTSYRTDMAYTYMIDNNQTDIYCHLSSDLCGSRGWTLVMKTDGSKDTFLHSAALWSNKNTFGLSAGKTGFDNHETKMPSYWAMPFKSLCVGMKVGNNLNWAHIPYPASSLYDVIANNTYTNVTIGREKWMSLIGGSTLKENCTAEGFNVGVHSLMEAVRIGVLGNDQDNCNSPNSAIGFGLLWHGATCGNRCRSVCKEGVNSIVAFGYVLMK